MDTSSQIMPAFQAFYRRYLVNEIGDPFQMTRLEQLTWAAALSELALEFRTIALSQEPLCYVVMGDHSRQS